ncbi:MAG: WXG100 family type VII secretion target, partial [Caldilineaceae bacterium]|nr:WXG100 family type VII secretion target [Caldilineaceae bacterium]
MAGDVIQVNYDELTAVAALFGQQGREQTDLVRAVQARAQVLIDGSWEGMGVAAFAAEIHGTVLPAMTRLISALEDAQRVTLDIHALMREAEEEAARPFRGEAYAGDAQQGAVAASEAGAITGPGSIPPPRIYIVNGINSRGNVLGLIGDDDSIELERLIERRGYDPRQVVSTPAIYGRPPLGDLNLDGTNLSGTNFGGWLSPADWITGAAAGGVNLVTSAGATIANAGSQAWSSLYGSAEVWNEYAAGEHGRYTQQTYNFVQRDLANNPLLPNQQVILMGHSGGGAVVDDLAGMIERKTGADVSAVVTLGSPISNYDVAGRYAEQVVDLQHRFDFVGKSYIRSDESRYALPLAMMSAPTPVQGVLRAVGLEQTLWRSVDDS